MKVIGFPTIISTDAMYTSSTAARERGMVRYIPTKKPDKVILDFDLIIRAPYRLNAAGWGDVLSIHTAVWDWRLAAESIGETYSPEVAEEALRLLDKAVRVDVKEGLECLNECLRAEVALCEEFGSARPEEGSEHLFAYLVENYLPTSYPHGELVALGIFELSKVQQNKVDSITSLMDQIGLKYRSEDLGIDEKLVKRVLTELPQYSRRHSFPYTVVDEMGEKWARIS
jgi:glycerol-1-phosphate dehydrogenase [NAD(P)+]